MIVLDSSAAVDYLVVRGPGEWVEERLLEAGEAHAPHLLDVEVANALRRLVRVGSVSNARARDALDDLMDLELTRYPHLPFLERMWELRDTLSASDAAFVALAEALGAPLVTTEASLTRVPRLRARILAP